jgi:hypothetical protein
LKEGVRTPLDTCVPAGVDSQLWYALPFSLSVVLRLPA